MDIGGLPHKINRHNISMSLSIPRSKNVHEMDGSITLRMNLKRKSHMMPQSTVAMMRNGILKKCDFGLMMDLV
jgi:hypothetical protein